MTTKSDQVSRRDQSHLGGRSRASVGPVFGIRLFETELGRAKLGGVGSRCPSSALVGKGPGVPIGRRARRHWPLGIDVRSGADWRRRAVTGPLVRLELSNVGEQGFLWHALVHHSEHIMSSRTQTVRERGWGFAAPYGCATDRMNAPGSRVRS
jgi:hypothetical protein